MDSHTSESQNILVSVGVSLCYCRPSRELVTCHHEGHSDRIFVHIVLCEWCGRTKESRRWFSCAAHKSLQVSALTLQSIRMPALRLLKWKLKLKQKQQLVEVCVGFNKLPDAGGLALRICPKTLDGNRSMGNEHLMKFRANWSVANGRRPFSNRWTSMPTYRAIYLAAELANVKLPAKFHSILFLTLSFCQFRVRFRPQIWSTQIRTRILQTKHINGKMGKKINNNSIESWWNSQSVAIQQISAGAGCVQPIRIVTTHWKTKMIKCKLRSEDIGVRFAFVLKWQNKRKSFCFVSSDCASTLPSRLLCAAKSIDWLGDGIDGGEITWKRYGNASFEFRASRTSSHTEFR